MQAAELWGVPEMRVPLSAGGWVMPLGQPGERASAAFRFLGPWVPCPRGVGTRTDAPNPPPANGTSV